jgi:glutamate racemase
MIILDDTNGIKPGRERSIGIFDSGIGGLTVVRQMIEKLPAESLIYFGDTARVPYGTKSDRAVREFAWEDSLFLLGHGVKMIVVACNTASAVALEELNHYLKIPVMGVIKPGAKAAAANTANKRVGVIGTQATVDSKAYEREIHRIDPEIEVITASCPLFVPLAEEGWLEGEIPEKIAAQYLTPLLDSEVDTLILGCTHYPLLKPLLAGVLGPSIQLVDSAEETTRAVEAVLNEFQLLSESAMAERRFYVSDLPRRFETLGARFLGKPIEDVAIAEPWKHVSPSQVTRSS